MSKKRFADGTMDPALLERMREIAAENTMRTGASHQLRRIPSDIMEAAMVYSRGVKATLFRYLHFHYGYTAAEIRDAFNVRAPAHVWNTINEIGSVGSDDLRADWNDVALNAKRNREAIDAEIAKAERKDKRAAAKEARELAAALKAEQQEKTNPRQRGRRRR